ncbi:aminotransferase class I/II-fold pyridoxal phosphate-dependent enzyme [Psychroflexus montanilacus]|uniref:aminotransferase class I/II-fold pyridoxal phosphate-dependent enzyme n=1 Tax=Psychroflexus montanilacus TaxID=2873598 RepID=UPI001CCA6BDE|nr:aminotransferase class I/II-fold pyridoxal phosphate-dependent enzyme [Psychroflexus montanilacus]MBZ9650873.1 bifunctional aminotransferase class I/II-fold pyridoxal phosphate-dependent enzyme/GNAT family N-acetyltransferase [Psychroflexus montanilacus]
MAKIKHNNLLDTVVSVMTNAKESGAIHLYAEGKQMNGRQVQIKGKKLFHFGTTGYLGLEQDQRLKQGAIEAIQNYGTEFPLSKSYISHPLYAELESLMTDIYGHPVVITKNSTLGHFGVIPSVVNDGDGVILDHQVHWSVQSAVAPLKLRSVPVEMIRHNNLDMLEDKLKKLQSKCHKIWYMADGMYSMYGDYAPIEELMMLCDKYPQLHIYFDDVHGMSWKGKHGSGYVMSILEKLPDRVILFGTMSKTFGASGAVMVCKDKNLQQRVKNFGGPLTFSVQLEPGSVGAAIASAKIHLSDEIYALQDELAERISYFNQCLSQTDLPLIVDNDSPVFYIGAGMPETGFNLMNRLMRLGFYVNIGFFPAVPVKNTGMRITISRHNQKEEIKGLVDALSEEFPKALKETGTTLERVHFAFGKRTKPTYRSKVQSSKLNLQSFSSITEIEPKLWNSTVGKNGFYDWNGLRDLEKIMSDQKYREHNNQFYYYVVKDENQKCVLATFVSFGLWKEDMLAPPSVSLALEKIRKDKPYYHTSTCLCLGSMITEGDHLYLRQDSTYWKEAFNLFLDHLEKLEKRLNAQYVILRDFPTKNESVKTFLQKKGFVHVAMPESAVYVNFNWNSQEEYVDTLSKRSRKHFRDDIEAYSDLVELQIHQKLSKTELDKSFQLYQAVKANNIGLNTFSYPYALFDHMNSSPQWEFISLYLKDTERTLAGVMFCYKNSNAIYAPAIVGMDYNYARTYNVYRQLLFQTILRAKDLDQSRIDFGLTAGFEKRKVGAEVIEKCAYIQARDNFALEALDWLRKD